MPYTELIFDIRQDVFLDHSAPNEVRYLSIIQLKNGIDKYWRRTAAKYVSEQPEGDANADSNNSAIEPDEKQKIKTRALDAGIVEPSRPLALQNALMIAKIMRYEFPQDWYGLSLRSQCTAPRLLAHIYFVGLMR